MVTAPLLAFIHPGKSFLPELTMYKRYFTAIGLNTIEIHPDDRKKHAIDIEWHMMGTHWKRWNKQAIVIHEYASASTPPLAKLKDQLKKWGVAIPDYRLFLNEAVAVEMNFQDAVPFGYRDMFISTRPMPLKISTDPALFDFVYAGSTDPNRKPERLLELFTKGSLQNSRLLVISRNYDRLKRRFKKYGNIAFEGPVPVSDLSNHLKKARFAIDYRPTTHPFGIQTSSKLLEYSANGMPVICSPGKWIQSFQQKNGGRFFMLDNDMRNFSLAKIEQFEYESPDLKNWTFMHQLQHSGVLKFLHKRTGLNCFNEVPESF